MYRRRSPRYRSSFRGRPRSTGGRRTHEPRRTGHWQRGNIALAPILEVSTTGDGSVQFLSLAQITPNLADDSTGVGRSYGNQIKFLEIGGIVFDWQFIAAFFRGTLAFQEQNLDVFAQVMVLSDRLDGTGAPVALNFNPFTNTTPVGLATATEVQDVDTENPTRIHYRHAVCLSDNEHQIDSTVIANFPTNQGVIRTQGSKSLRLKLRLDDEHGLFFLFSLHTDNQYPSEGFSSRVKCMFVGSIYYRTVIQ